MLHTYQCRTLFTLSDGGLPMIVCVMYIHLLFLNFEFSRKSILIGALVTPTGIIHNVQMTFKDKKEHANSSYYDMAKSDLTYFSGERDGS